jgi:DNA processing protein
MEIRKLKQEEIPVQLLEIPQPPETLYVRGTFPSKDSIFLTVVGSRKYTSYGRDVCEKLIKGLEGYPIVIVSGLALGIDAIAHAQALKTGLTTVAFPGSGLSDSVLYPKTNITLAKEILKNNGCLVSEHEPNFVATIYSFPERNRLMAGISKATLIIEAEEKSGTLVTARMALDYNRDVLAVPGSVFSTNSKGTNTLIKQGAIPITNSSELLEALGFEIEKTVDVSENRYATCSAIEKKIIKLLHEPLPKDELVRQSGMNIQEINAVLSLMEIKELIIEELGEIKLV